MGFELDDNEKLYKLIFEDTPGLVVYAREPSLDQMMHMNELGDIDAKKLDMAAMRSMFRTFAGLLDSWNVTRKGEPVPADYDGIATMSAGLVMKILNALAKAVMEPDPTLPGGSPSGGTSAEVPPALASASRSLRN